MLHRLQVRNFSAARRLLLACGLIVVVTALPLLAAEYEKPKPNQPRIAAASDEGQRAISSFKIPSDLKIELYAAEPMMANPVAFAVDEKGRVFVAESYRQSKGVEDNRGHMNWLDDDLAAQTVEDRAAFFKKHQKEKVSDYAKEDDLIRLLEDTDGDGKADKATIFAEGFNDIIEGTGAGVLARHGDVYYTCIPKLWKLQDKDGNGQADVRKPLQHGYGVRVAFRGHDMHGLRFGPDGKLYFSIGDRGLNVETEGRRIVNTESGAVLRCNPDGTELEMIATGLRNPQELAFDQYGNLFTGDNNSDSGDRARWVYIVEGSDNGWRMAYQYLKDRGPFNREKLWHPQHEGQPAYLAPPVLNFADGPSGLTYYPGTGLPDRYKEHFFLCDFRGGPSNSGIHAFTVRPKGASFELVAPEKFVWSMLVTDVDFAPDGSVLISDWVNGWNGEGKGRIYRVSDPSQGQAALAKEVKELLGSRLEGLSAEKRLELLKHPDMRVRQEAQFSLAAEGKANVAGLLQVARDTSAGLGRLHAIWGLGQIGRKDAAQLEGLLPLAKDADLEVRAQLAKVLGEAKAAAGFDVLISLLKDENLRVRSFAALAIGKLGRPEAAAAAIQMLKENNDVDAVLRHTGVMALVGSGNSEAIGAAAKDASPAVRMGALLAMRRTENPAIAMFLNDADPRLVVEAARAINDMPINAAMPQLAALISNRTLKDDALLRRVLNANFRLGAAENAAHVAAFAARTDAPEGARIEALQMLGDWAKPSNRDRVMGIWRPLASRDAKLATEALRTSLGGIFSGSNKLRSAATEVTGKLGIKEVVPALMEMIADSARPASVRVEAIRAIESMKDARLSEAMEKAIADKDPVLRGEGRRVLAVLRPTEALPKLVEALGTGETVEKQAALAALATIRGAEAENTLLAWMESLTKGEVAPELRLDVLEAAGKSLSVKVRNALIRYENARPKNDPLAAYAETVAGGNAERGRAIFFERAEVSCLRCHKVGGVGGEVGPDLTKIGVDKKREYFVEAIVDPNKTIAKGFETVVLALDDGTSVAGILKSENDKELTLVTPEAKLLTIDKATIDERNTGKSAMPADVVKQLSRNDIRDLVEFLSNQKP